MHSSRQLNRVATRPTLTAPTTSSLSNNINIPYRQYNNTQYLSAASTEADSARFSHSPVSTIESSPASSIVDFEHTNEYYMQANQPQQHQQQVSNPRQQAIDAAGLPQAYWSAPRSAIGPTRVQWSQPIHKRTSSDSTVYSAGLQSPFTPTSFPQHIHQPFIVDQDTQHFYSNQELYDHDRTSTQANTAFTDYSFCQPTFTNQHNATSQKQYDQALREVYLQQQAPYLLPHRQVFRNMDHESGEKNSTMQEKPQPLPLGKIPGFGRTISAICEDELYNVVEPSVPAQASQRTGVATTPTNSVFTQRLQAANQSHLDAQRSASPTQSINREKSPFRPHMRPDGVVYEPPTSPSPRTMHSAAQIREFQKAEEAANALQNATRRTSRESSVTVSPKEVSLEYEPPENEIQGQLFGALPSPTRHARAGRQPSKLQQELTRTSTYEAILKREESSNVSNESVTSAGSLPIQVPQQYPFIRTRPAASGAPESSQESNPQFIPRLISMESTKSEGSPTSADLVNLHEQSISEPASQNEGDEEEQEDSDTPQQEVSRPSNTQADGGTYTCTYHGCSQRFETPQKLQKHKKEGHRQGTPSQPENRLTQAGPHKCTRINPSTGKPCNSVFSRPYDLTRHEDTIHNGKKQKVRCMICTEEKTFSRNDALTRHMRVVHPDVDFPGKTSGKRNSR